MVKSIINGTVPSSGRGGTAAAMVVSNVIHVSVTISDIKTAFFIGSGYEYG